MSSFAAIVLAGDRSAHDPLVEAASVPCKALVPVGNVPMVIRVLNALQVSRCVDRCLLVGPPWSIIEETPALRDLVDTNAVLWQPTQPTPSRSAGHALETLAPETPVVLTTADHALLNPEMVEYFCARVSGLDCDLAVGLAPASLVKAAFPESKRTVIRLQDGGYCGCNLFAFLTPKARTAVTFWRGVEQDRKIPWKLIRRFGWGMVIRYALRRLSLEDGLRGASRVLGLEVGAVVMPFAEAAVDVDSVDDWRLVQAVAGSPANP